MIDGTKVRDQRERLGMTVIDLSVRTGIDPTMIDVIEQGQMEQPDRETMLVLAKALLVDAEEISK